MFQSLLRLITRWLVVSAAVAALQLPSLASLAQQPAPAAEIAAPIQSGVMTDDQLRQMLVGKNFYLRGGYLDDNLSFTEHGALIGHSPQGSYTLNLVEIDRVRLTKHKVELDGVRYGMHFLGALPYEDPEHAMDRVRITPKKKVLRITIDRELIIKPKKEKTKKPNNLNAAAHIAASSSSSTADSGAGTTQPDDAGNPKSDIAAAPAAEQSADPASVTTTTSPQHAATLLKEALQNILAASLDARMLAGMPDFWKLFYQAQAEKTDFHPADPAVLRQTAVDRKARLLTSFEPDSNEYAQQNGVAGMALYHAVIGTDGKPGEIAVARPIGFGLDENAVASIRNARFEPAMKDGKLVPVLLDLVVEFRIYSNRTAAHTGPENAGSENSAVAETLPADKKEVSPTLPGPYSVQHPAQ
jgi:Gram-negative bacterial TonB protein C-terminal